MTQYSDGVWDANRPGSRFPAERIVLNCSVAECTKLEREPFTDMGDLRFASLSGMISAHGNHESLVLIKGGIDIAILNCGKHQK